MDSRSDKFTVEIVPLVLLGKLQLPADAGDEKAQRTLNALGGFLDRAEKPLAEGPPGCILCQRGFAPERIPTIFAIAHAKIDERRGRGLARAVCADCSGTLGHDHDRLAAAVVQDVTAAT
jgi:hypothetical protein